MNWTVKAFNELTLVELYEILRARNEVFVVEQNCAYLDQDRLDYRSTHLFAETDGEIAAYCRITPKGTRFPEISIGRVITTPKYRSQGMGRELMERAIKLITADMRENGGIRISGQAYLRAFYESLGFEVVSGEYLEDEIPHFEMFRKGER